MTRETTPRRVFDHQQVWRVTPQALCDATALLAAAIHRDHDTINHVIGVAHGGIAPARILASRFGVRPRAIRARHNSDNAVYKQATGKVQVELDALCQALGRRRLEGRVLLVDDICGSGATLQKVRNVLAPLLAPGAETITATLCLNTGATTPPGYSIWTVSDWVTFPWEAPPGSTSTDLTVPEEATLHA